MTSVFVPHLITLYLRKYLRKKAAVRAASEEDDLKELKHFWRVSKDMDWAKKHQFFFGLSVKIAFFDIGKVMI